MRILLRTLKKILFWSYERGSWQYDVMCVLILAFIFFGPNSLFHSQRSSLADEAGAGPVFVSRDEVGPVDSINLEKVIGDRLSEKYGHRVVVSGIKQVKDDSGNVAGYLAWEKK
jgi:hypothetical protein